jgi:hypothetical protein
VKLGLGGLGSARGIGLKAALIALITVFGFSTIALAEDVEGSEASIHVIPGSNINLLARQTNIPITIENPTEATALVTVWGKTESFRLEVLNPTNIEVPAKSSAIAQLPVRAIANGPVTLRVWLTVDGERVGQDYVVGVNVNYDVEVFIVVTFGVLLFGLMVIGILRTAVRLRRRLVSQ